jgi:hypothetical protein
MMITRKREADHEPHHPGVRRVVAGHQPERGADGGSQQCGADLIEPQGTSEVRQQRGEEGKQPSGHKSASHRSSSF